MPITVALELERVLRGAYKLSREAVITAFEGLLAIRHLHLEQEELVKRGTSPAASAVVRGDLHDADSIPRDAGWRHSFA
ncbi:hypothetical protein [Synechococcus sp. CBW1006]|uniref:hypothetical protein n=1 Tax=Synechococcus sp. CBW1006 TaxID=1353138 RepID=UPI0018CFEA4B|nr:hypothetical protein [Synechococcus sp. CBW1006]QPN65901.1 hypothetical protein H8F26_13635 [Synechococcus sp. CBW1006]